MARPIGTTLETVAAFKLSVFKMLDEGAKQKEIAGALGVSAARISQVIKAGRDNLTVKADVLNQIVDARRVASAAGGRAGPQTIMYELSQLGVDENDMPSFSTVSTRIRAAGLTVSAVGGAGDKRRYHNYFLNDESKFEELSAPCQRFMFDFYGPLEICGEKYYIACMTDKFSHYTHCEIVPHQFGNFIVQFFHNAFDVMGVPIEVQCDNAFGIRADHGRPSTASRKSFAGYGMLTAEPLGYRVSIS